MTPEATPTVCVNHPNREATLRCNRCGEPICVDCAVHTPTGYRCKTCVREHQRQFHTARWYDFLTALLLGGGVSFLGSLITTFIGWLVVFLAPTAGILIAEAIRLGVRKRRSPALFRTAAAATALGALPMLWLGWLGGGLWGVLWQGVYLALVVPAVYYRLSGIVL